MFTLSPVVPPVSHFTNCCLPWALWNGCINTDVSLCDLHGHNHPSVLHIISSSLSLCPSTPSTSSTSISRACTTYKMRVPWGIKCYKPGILSERRSEGRPPPEIRTWWKFLAFCLTHPEQCWLQRDLEERNLTSSSSVLCWPFICSRLAAGGTCSTLTWGHSSNQFTICRKGLHNSDIFPPRQ